MLANNSLGDLLTTLFDRQPFGRKAEDGERIVEYCRALLSDKAETSGLQYAIRILNQYTMLNRDQKEAFFAFLNDELDLDAAEISALAMSYTEDPSVKNFKTLSSAAEPRRQELFRQLNEAPGATAEIVKMRKDLLTMLKTHPELAKTDHDLVHLLRSWFNRGFLVMRQINWDSPASILEKIIAYEAVHQIRTWDDLRLRLHPADRRCFAFFHPAMPDEPLIFVEVALTKGVPNSIQGVLSDNRETIDESAADTAVFYSISNCQDGLAQISFGNSLIKQVARDLSQELPNVKTFVTLSPIPGLIRWLEQNGETVPVDDPEKLAKLAASYLIEAKTPDGRPLNAVARFHLGNGAIVHAIHPVADLSENGLAQSAGAMVNYHYDLSRISQNVLRYAMEKKVPASTAVRSLARQAAKEQRV